VTHGRVVGTAVEQNDGSLRHVFDRLDESSKIQTDGLRVVVGVRDGVQSDVADDGVVIG
jgi:hypothetical protein